MIKEVETNVFNLNETETPLIFKDLYFLACIKLALMSKGNERYGSVLVSNSQIIGKGFNRAIAHPSFKLERIVKQGMANHAEIEALNDALMNGLEVKGSSIYVAGYFPSTKQLFFKTDYTCVKCIPYLEKYGIGEIFVPLPFGWVGKSLDLALSEAKKFKNGTHEKRLIAQIGNFPVNFK
jgi:deoxycytidylate deaminase